ncbi:hypothetical protein EDF44_1557 [Rathayibacter sp. PhB185]|nr:hypothetical protein EDF45_1557 [Rathayibacter sp. PhB186]ROS53106.1 hypothetical protein EDF44_1557 [Rathayibacter sp. PhB185]
MTTTQAPQTRRPYQAQLRRELAVLPRRSRRSLLQEASEHAADTADTADHPGIDSSFGDPVMIARTALEQQDTNARHPSRPSPLMPSKLLQLVAAVLASPLAVIAVIDLLARDSSVDSFSDSGPDLVRILLWALLALPPLFARWTTWWRASVACTTLYACYLTIALIVFLGGWNVPSAGIVFLISGPLAISHALALALSLIALFRAPRALRLR